MSADVKRTVIILQLLLTLLSSSWAQAGNVRMNMPVTAIHTTVSAALIDESVPPCHRAAMIEEATNMAVSKMPCCADAGDCQCDGLCQQVSFPSLGLDGLNQQTGSIQKAFSLDSWMNLSPVSLFRPPIHNS